MADKYNTVMTGKYVDSTADARARQALGRCNHLTPETEAAIDLALGIGTRERPELQPIPDVTIFDAEQVEDIMVAAGPTDAEIAAIEAEEKN